MTTYHEQPDTMGPPLGLYSHIASAAGGSLIAIAGQTGVTADGALTGDGSVDAQTTQSFVNLGLALTAASASFSDVLKTTTFVVGRSSVAPFMAARRRVFEEIYPDGRFPPNTLLIVEGLVEERFLVEIEAFAVVH